MLEYPLQGLNGLAAGVAAGLAGRPPAAVVASPEASLDEIAGLSAAMAGGDPPLEPPPTVEALVFGRQQVLHTRDQLGRAEGLFEAPGPARHVGLLLEDAKGYEFPADVDAGGTRLFNARVTNLAPNLDELRAAGVATFLVVQSDLDVAERAAFAAGGLAGAGAAGLPRALHQLVTSSAASPEAPAAEPSGPAATLWYHPRRPAVARRCPPGPAANPVRRLHP